MSTGKLKNWVLCLNKKRNKIMAEKKRQMDLFAHFVYKVSTVC